MKRVWYGAGLVTLSILGVLAGGPSPWANAQEDAEPQRSVYGSLLKADAGQGALIMTTGAGEHLAWRVNAATIERTRQIEPGAEMIVIYRQTRPDEKIATAVAFPGTASAPTYVNTTDSRVVLRTGPRVDGVCHEAEAVNEVPILAGGQAETSDACWCCAPAGESCQPTTQTGNGQAFLLRCF